jgi:hypothetical protein
VAIGEFVTGRSLSCFLSVDLDLYDEHDHIDHQKKKRTGTHGGINSIM